MLYAAAHLFINLCKLPIQYRVGITLHTVMQARVCIHNFVGVLFNPLNPELNPIC